MSELDNKAAIIRKLEPLLSNLSGYELTVLNRMIVERVQLRNKAEELISMSKFNVGERVSFNGSDGIVRTGIIIRMNRKTASVKINDNTYWTVSPQLLRKEV